MVRRRVIDGIVLATARECDLKLPRSSHVNLLQRLWSPEQLDARLQRNLQGVGFPGLWRDLTHVVVEQAFSVGRQRVNVRQRLNLHLAVHHSVNTLHRRQHRQRRSDFVALLVFQPALRQVRQLFGVVTQRHADRFIAFVKHQTGAIRGDRCMRRQAGGGKQCHQRCADEHWTG